MDRFKSRKQQTKYERNPKYRSTMWKQFEKEQQEKKNKKTS